MRILINCSNLKQGGGVQVADSICRFLHNITEHSFVVVLSSYLDSTACAIKSNQNIKVIRYDVKNTLATLLFGRDATLDSIVKKYAIDAVLTVFGPSRWIPKCAHVCGFARAQLLLMDSPYIRQLDKIGRFKATLLQIIWSHLFRKCSNVFHTENPMISKMLEQKFHGTKVYTVTNYYNQVFDEPENQIDFPLTDFDGLTLLTISTPYPHKNMKITLEVARLLKEQHPNFRFRFVLTAKEENFDYDFKRDIYSISENIVLIGRVDVRNCPSLYRQSDICFQPSLLECFTATYCEAMRMGKPIVTTNLPFARGLCGSAAFYYDATDAQSCADAIYHLANNPSLQKNLIVSGKKQLDIFDNYESRARKLIEITANQVNK